MYVAIEKGNQEIAQLLIFQSNIDVNEKAILHANIFFYIISKQIVEWNSKKKSF